MRTRFNWLCVYLVVLASALAACAATPAGSARAAEKTAKFYLVGTGPGDPDLITLRAIRVMREADLVFCSESLKRRFAPHLGGKEVRHVAWYLFQYYGQDPAELEGQQRRRCEQLAEQRSRFVAQVRRAAQQGKQIAVLDGGDPLIYGPLAWCLEEFEDLDPVVVPGLSCFNAANAALRRGVTTGEHTKSVILTATDFPGTTDTIDKLSVHRSTMAIFTMKAEFKEFIKKLSVNYPPETPVAVVKHAGYAEKEEVVQGTLATILNQVGAEGLPFEYMIYVGDFLTHRYK